MGEVRYSVNKQTKKTNKMSTGIENHSYNVPCKELPDLHRKVLRAYETFESFLFFLDEIF